MTERLPKALIPVSGRPFADWQLTWLAAQGIERVVYSVGYLGQQIEEALGDGHRWRLDIQYVPDGPRLLGTGGALRRAVDAAGLDTFFVIYGDSYLNVSLSDVAVAFGRGDQPALMTVLRNRGQWDSSNAHLAHGLVERYGKGVRGDQGMEYIDYGLSVFDASVITGRLAVGQSGDLADLYTELSAEGALAGYEVHDRFYEVGSPQGLADLEAYLEAVCRTNAVP